MHFSSVVKVWMVKLKFKSKTNSRFCPLVHNLISFRCKKWFRPLRSIPSFHQIFTTKGQSISEWIFEVIVSPKIQMKNCQDFCPHYTGQKSWRSFIHILGETMTSKIHSEIDWPLKISKSQKPFMISSILEIYRPLGILLVLKTNVMFFKTHN